MEFSEEEIKIFRKVMNERKRKYREENNEKVLCFCGREYIKHDLGRHLKSKKHNNYFLNISGETQK